MHDDRTLVEARLKRVLDERIRPAVYPESVPLEVAVWNAPGEPVPVAEGLAAPPEPIAVGARWGAPWGTSWFRVTGHRAGGVGGPDRRGDARPRLRREHARLPVRGPGLPPDGTPVKGLNPRNQWVRVGAPVEGGEEVRLHIEAASNPVILDYHPFLPTQLGDKETAGSEPQYTLARMDLAVLDETVWQLVMDLEVLGELMAELPVDVRPALGHPARGGARPGRGRPPGRERHGGRGPRAAARTCWPRPPCPSAHRISAVGHAHIDSAWLWPLRETVRKVARTTSNMTALLEDEPDFVFAMSQAQQWAWIKEHRPEVWARVKKAVADGRFVPAGGMWVESDTNMPGSEAMARQFVHGKRFFLDEFGIENDEAWLPDTFGFAAGLPQIIKAGGLQVAAHAEDLVVADQQVPAPHVPVGGHRRHPDLHALPARRHLQLLHEGQRDRPRGDATSRTRASPGTRSRPPAGATAAAAPTREMVAKAAPAARPGRLRARWCGRRPEEFFDKAEAEYPEPAGVGRRAVPGTAPRHPHQPGQDQAGQPAQRAPAARGRAVGGDRRGAGRDSPTPTRSWTGSGRRCCCTSSTTSCPARRSPGCTARRAGRTRRVAEELNGDHRRGPARAGRRRARRTLVFNSAPHARGGVPAGGARRRRSSRATGRARAARRRRIRPRQRPAAGRDRRPGPGRVRVRPRRGPRDRGARPGREPAADPPRLPEHVGRVGRRRVLPQHGHRPDRRRRGALAPGTDARPVRVVRSFGASRVVQVAHAGRRARSGSDIDTEVDWHETEKFLKLAFPLDIHAERYAVRDPVRALLPAHAHQHQLGGRQVRGVQPPVRAHRGAGLGRRRSSTTRRTATTSPVPCGDGDARHDDHGPASRCCARRASPTRETDQGVHRFRHALVPGAAIGDAVREGYRINLPERRVTGCRRGRAAGGRRQRRGGGDRGQAGRRRQRRRGGPLLRVPRRTGARHADGGLRDRRPSAVTDLLERPLADAADPERDGDARSR